MSFRQAKHDDREASLRWLTWIDQHRTELLAVGLPGELFTEASVPRRCSAGFGCVVVE